MLKKIFFIILFLALINLAIADTYKMRFNPHTNKSDWVINQLSSDNVSLDSALDGKILFNANGAISSDNELLYNKDTNRLTVSYISADGSLLSNIPAGNPAGSNTQVQFNDGGSFGGDVGFTYNKITDTASIGALDLTTALPDAEVADDITLTNITQITNRSHASLTDIGTNTHANIDTFISSKAQASGLASLDISSLVVQNPANATTTPTASKIPIADGSGKLDGWITAYTAGRSLTLTGQDFTADAELYTKRFNAGLENPVAADDNLLQCEPAGAFTITEIACSTDTGTATINFNENINTTPDTAGTAILSADIACDSNRQSSCASGCDVNTISNAGITAGNLISMVITSVASSPTKLRVHIKGTYDD